MRTQTPGTRPSSTPSGRLSGRAAGAHPRCCSPRPSPPSPSASRMLLHRPKLALRVPFEWILRVPAVSRVVWWATFRFLYRDGSEYRDDIEGFTFFMDGNARAKRIAGRLGFTLKNAQQTFVVPRRAGQAGGMARLRGRVPARAQAQADAARRPLPAEGQALPAVGQRRPGGIRRELRVRDVESQDAGAGTGGLQRPRGRPMGEVRRPRLPGQERVRPSRRRWRRCTASAPPIS